MRVLFIGRSHAFSTAPLDALRCGHELVGVVESAPRDAPARPNRLKLAARAIKRRVVGRASLADYARSADTPYLWLDKRSRENLLPFVRQARPSIICAASLTQLLEPAVLDTAPHGAINLHPSLLPKYHGPFPWFWQYHDFELDIGVTVHQLDEGQDTGPLLLQAPIRLDLGMDIIDAVDRVAPIGGALMAHAVAQLEAGTAEAVQQPVHEFPKARIVTRNERFVDWETWSLERVFHFMRGVYPWVDVVDAPAPVRATRMVRGEPNAPPGTIGRDDSGRFVAHRGGQIRLA